MDEGPRFVSRGEWGASIPREETPLEGPMEHVCFTYSTGLRDCVGDEDCNQVLRELQQTSMARGLADLPYNFLVGGDGTVYEGRGWRSRSSRTLGHKGRDWLPRLDIGFIGDYCRETLPKAMYYSGIDTVYHGVRNQLIVRQYSFQENRRAPWPGGAPDRPPRPTYTGTTFAGVNNKLHWALRF